MKNLCLSFFLIAIANASLSQSRDLTYSSSNPNIYIEIDTSLFITKHGNTYKSKNQDMGISVTPGPFPFEKSDAIWKSMIVNDSSCCKVLEEVYFEKGGDQYYRANYQYVQDEKTAIFSFYCKEHSNDMTITIMTFYEPEIPKKYIKALEKAVYSVKLEVEESKSE